MDFLAPTVDAKTFAVVGMNRESNPPMVRAICKAYIETFVPRRIEFMRAALRNMDYKAWGEGEIKSFYEFSIESLVLNTPAIWEFEFVRVVGSVNDANWCACSYRWNSFIGVHPLEPDTPFNHFRIPILHKENSRFRVGWENRNRLKAQLGSRYRKLVNDARSLGKAEFLSEFAKPESMVVKIKTIMGNDKEHEMRKRVRHIEAHRLLELTGYSPEEFWREVDFLKRNNGEHVQPFKLDMFDQRYQAPPKPDVVAVIPKQKPQKPRSQLHKKRLENILAEAAAATDADSRERALARCKDPKERAKIERSLTNANRNDTLISVCGANVKKPCAGGVMVK